jgi:hypothetical protein
MLNREVGFALNNGHRQPSLSGPKSAKLGSGPFRSTRRKPGYAVQIAMRRLDGYLNAASGLLSDDNHRQFWISPS